MQTDFMIPTDHADVLDVTKWLKADDEHETCVRLYRSQPSASNLQIRVKACVNNGRGKARAFVMSATMNRAALLALRAAIDENLADIPEGSK